MNRSTRFLSLFVAALAISFPIIASPQQSDEVEAAEYQQAVQDFLDSLDPQTGEISLGDNLATLTVPDDYYFLDAEDARAVLVDAWGNPPETGDVLGLLFPARYSPLDQDAWAVSIEYVEDGFVSDEDASEIDYDEMLADMKSDIRASNQSRVDAGYGSIELLGWAEAPRYDAVSRKLYWAKELQFDGSDSTTLNYDIRALGRKGILSMTFIAAGDQLEEINRSRDDVLAMAEFNDGMRYEDFDPSIDKVAAYGIGALVAGKVAAKAGLFGIALVFLKKFGIFILLGIAAFGKRLLGMFRSDKSGAP